MLVFKKDDYRVPVFSWCRDIEENAQLQLDNMARLPFVTSHIAAMGDTHSGFGVVIGGVIACEGVVVMSGVGKDIGCGVLLVRTNILEFTVDHIKQIMGQIRQRIPLGFDWHRNPIAEPAPLEDDLPIVRAEFSNAKKQLGTLGSGNHFVELQENSQGLLHFMIHSGSRNLGSKVADHYDKIAKKWNERWYSSVPKEWDLAFLPIETQEAKLYLKEMTYAVNFAQMNRDVMAEQVRESIRVVMGDDVEFGEPINIAHNYASWENINGKNLLVHRKGATSARDGQIGLIPGSQGSASYVVRGLGNPKSFYSCSHGAGRQMGRKQAQRTLDLQAEIKKLDEQGIVHGIRHQKDLDEAAGAYKDIDDVMEQQRDLVTIIDKMLPRGVIKA